MDQSAADLKLVTIKTRKLFESAIYLEPGILRAALALGDLHVGEGRNKDAILLLERDQRQ